MRLDPSTELIFQFAVQSHGPHRWPQSKPLPETDHLKFIDGLFPIQLSAAVEVLVDPAPKNSRRWATLCLIKMSFSLMPPGILSHPLPHHCSICPNIFTKTMRKDLMLSCTLVAIAAVVFNVTHVILMPESPDNPDWGPGKWSFGQTPPLICKMVRSPGSISPERVPITNPLMGSSPWKFPRSDHTYSTDARTVPKMTGQNAAVGCRFSNTWQPPRQPIDVKARENRTAEDHDAVPRFVQWHNAVPALAMCHERRCQRQPHEPHREKRTLQLQCLPHWLGCEAEQVE